MSIENILVDGIGQFIENSQNAGVVTQGVFADSAINSGLVTTTASFSGNAVNSGIVAQAEFTGSASNTGTVTVAVFKGTAVNTGSVEHAEFRDMAVNSGTVSVSAFFADSASNAGVVQGNAIFADTSENTGEVQGDAQVAATATNTGTVSGNTSEYIPGGQGGGIPDSEFTDASIDGSFNVTPYSYTTYNGLFYMNGTPYTGIHDVTVYIVQRDEYGTPTGYSTSHSDIEFIGGALWHADSSNYSPKQVLHNGAVALSDEGSGIKAAAFDGNSSFTVLPNADLDISTSDFTIETWFKVNSLDSANSASLMTKDTVAYQHRGSYEIVVVGDKVHFAASSTDPWGAPELEVSSTSSYSFGTWNHVAVTRQTSTNTIRLFLNGHLEVETQLPFATNDFGRALTLGRSEKAYPGSVLNGKLAGVRIVKGNALYTSDFSVPTTLPTAVTGTQLLLNFGATVAPTV